MPRNTNSTIENSFTNGLITQGTALAFPKDACIDQDNCIFSERSIVTRRLGFEFENNAATSTQDRTEKAQNVYYWKNASGDGLTNLVIQQNGDLLSLYNTGNTQSLSAGLLVTTINLNSAIAAGATSNNLNQNECQFATGLGYLFVTHPYCDPFYIKYNSDGSLTSSIITFTIRDVFGVPETGNVQARPLVLSPSHGYNIINQGWDIPKFTAFQAALSGAYPSNADVWWTFVDVNNIYNPATMINSVSAGSSPAPQGFIKLNPWNTSRRAACVAQNGFDPGALPASADQTSGSLRPSAVEFHAGRVWYAGVNASGYSNQIYFTNVVQSPDDFGYCGSVNDPTSQTAFDFLASDGGIISIPQAGTIYRMISMGSTLLVFGANGIWAVSGSRGIGFAANDYSISPVSYTRGISSTSYVIAEGIIYFWNQTDINAIQLGDNGYSVKSLTYNTIKDFYNEIDTTSKKFARGVYNPRTHVIQWLYRTATTTGLSDTYTFDTILNYNLLSSSFYTWSSDTSVGINGAVVIEGVGSTIGATTITDNSLSTVTDSLGNPLTSYGFTATSVQTTTKYLVSYPSAGSYNFTFAEEFNTAYVDWFLQTGGKDYESFFTTGYLVKTMGERRFQTPYIYIFSDLQEVTNPTFKFQGQWDYANSNLSGRFTQVQTIAHTEANRDDGRRRLSVRGSGIALQFTFSSVSGRPFSIVGWSTYDTADQQP